MRIDQAALFAAGQLASGVARRGGGSILVTCSTAGIEGYVGASPYVTEQAPSDRHDAHGGASSAPLKIRFNTVNPAPIESRMIRLLEGLFAPGQPGQAEKQFPSTIPLAATVFRNRAQEGRKGRG